MSARGIDIVSENLSGKIIALEGDTHIISTQLRLLPPSQKILILPNVEEKYTPEHKNDAFNARVFIRDLQTAVTQRTETARSFLQLSTPTQPRLVFTVHGNVSARTTCITKISQNLTSGNVEEAESIFNNLVKNGIAGLSEPEEERTRDGGQTEIQDYAGDCKENEEAVDISEEPRDIVESQDRDTVVSDQGVTTLTQPPSRDTYLTYHTTSVAQDVNQSMKVRGLHKPVPASQFGPPASQPGDQITTTVLTVPNRKSRISEKRAELSSKDAEHLDRRIGGLLHQAENETDIDDDFYEPKTTSSSNYSVVSAPQTPSGFSYGEACLVDMQSSSPTNSLRKAKSFDKLQLSDFQSQDLLLSAHQLKRTKSHSHLKDSPTNTVGRGEQNTSRFLTHPRTTFMKGLETTIKKSPATSTRSSRPSDSSIEPVGVTDHATYVERGTDVHDLSSEKMKELPFVPVFKLVEDLVIHFTGSQPNEIFESVVRSYKSGNYPAMNLPPTTPTSSVMPSFSTSPSDQNGDETLFSPRSISDMQLEVDPDARPSSNLTSKTEDFRYHRRSFDPYSDESYSPDINRQWPPRGRSKIAKSSGSNSGLPTPPVDTESSLLDETKGTPLEDRFVDFSPINVEDQIGVQNSFRELLSILFPLSENYRQYLYPIDAEVDRLWKPVFKNEEIGPAGIENMNVDQIIAFGCEDGVKKDYFHKISGQIENMGIKKDGLSRSGKLDVRYLISNVTQSYTTSSITPGAQSPISDPHVLAALLVPQIEAYLASNFSTRLLILHFSSANLPTILALQNLLGKNLFRIAGILDTLASDPPPIIRPGTALLFPSRPSTSMSSRSRLTSSTSQTRKSKSSFAKADYLLPSTATDAEISTFLSGMWKILMEKSPFYTPEPEPKPIVMEMPIPPTPSSAIPRDCDSGRSLTPRVPRVSFLAGENSTLASGSARRASYASSVTSLLNKSPGTGSGAGAGPSNTLTRSGSTSTPPRQKYPESVTSTKTSASDRERKKGDKEWENFYIEDDDSDDDAYDKMILGRGMQKITPEVKKPGQKANTKKALKWLGLA
ncbi:hypothetical protein WAI453_003555 [Rhynchosporium graminicola]